MRTTVGTLFVAFLILLCLLGLHVGKVDLQSASCDQSEFRCDNGQCIPDQGIRCDAYPDCSDSSDEPPIFDSAMCPPCDSQSEFRCDNGQCIPDLEGIRCDADPDCSDSSDEPPIFDSAMCPSCNSSKFRCDNGQCIHNFEVCDFIYHCNDRSDEMQSDNENCSCGCTGVDRCDDGGIDCNDLPWQDNGSDELFCNEDFLDLSVETSSTEITLNWQSNLLSYCNSGQCFPKGIIDVKIEVFLINKDDCLSYDGIGMKVDEIIVSAYCYDGNYYDYYGDYPDNVGVCVQQIANLEPHSTYNVNVTAGDFGLPIDPFLWRNYNLRKVKMCLPLTPQSVIRTTWREDPSSGPTNLAVSESDTTPSSLTFSWDLAACGDRNRNIDGYVYDLCDGTVDMVEAPCDGPMVGPIATTDTSVTINALECNTVYTFVVHHAWIDDPQYGELGPPSTISERTAIPAPTGISSSQSPTGELIVSWSPPNCGSTNPVTSYSYILCPEELPIEECIEEQSKRKRRSVSGEVTTTSVSFSDIPCSEAPRFIVAGINGDGMVGEWSNPYTILPEPTSGPTSLEANEITASLLRFSWAPATCGDTNYESEGFIYRLCEGPIGASCVEPAIGPSFTAGTSVTIDQLACDTECTIITSHGVNDGGSLTELGAHSALTVWTETTAVTEIGCSQSSHGLTCSWEPPDCGSTQPAMTYQYNICPSKSFVNGECEPAPPSGRKRRQSTTMSGQTSSSSLLFNDFPCDEAFTFMVAGVNGGGAIGQWSDPYDFTTDGAQSANSLSVRNVANGVEVSWSRPNSGCSASGYIIEYSLVNQDQCMDIANPSRSEYGMFTESPVTVTDLIPYSSYRIYITPTSLSGDRGPSVSTTLHTVSATVPPVAPGGVRNTAQTATSLSFEWQPIPCGERRGIIGAYDCRLVLANTGEIVREFRKNQPDSLSTTIFGLEPFVQYGFSVAADIKYGDDETGPYSEVVLVTTLPIPSVAPSSGSDGDYVMPTAASTLSASVYLARSSYTVNEDVGSVLVVIQKTSGQLSLADIFVNTLVGSASPGADFQAVSLVLDQQIDIPYEVVVPIVADQLHERDEYFYVQIQGRSVSGTSLATITIIDDDEPEPTDAPPLPPPKPAVFAFDKPFYFISERGDGILPVRVIRTGNTATTANLRVKSTGTTAFDPLDYEDIDESILFSSGQTSVSLEIQIKYDTTPEGSETFVLRLWNNTGLRLLDQSQVTITEGMDDNQNDANSTLTARQATCPSERLSTPYGDVSLRAADISKIIKSGLRCPTTTENAGVSVVTAECTFDPADNVAYWDWEINCGEDYGAEATLQQLTQDPITDETVMEILTNTEELTRRELGVTGVVDTATIVDQSVRLGSVSREVTSTLVKVVDNLINFDSQVLFDANQQTEAPTRIVSAMETQLQHVDLSVFHAYRQIEKNVAVEVIMAEMEDFQNGLGVASYDTSGTRHRGRTDLTLLDGPELPSRGQPEAALYLPKDTLNPDDTQTTRVSFTVLSSSDILPSAMLAETNEAVEPGEYKRVVNSRVISAIVGREDNEPKALNSPAIISFKPVNPRANNTECVFWDFQTNDWSSEGCRSLGKSGDLQQCECDHLTNFAVLMDIYGQRTLTKTQDYILEILSYVGCCLSALGLIVTLATYGNNKKLRSKNPGKILMNLCGALLGLYLVFIVMISVDTSRGKAEIPGVACGILAGLLHYFTLASLCWMMVEGFNMYLMFVKVVNSYVSSLLLKASIVGWGIPAVVVIVTGAAARSSYARSDFCFLEKFPLVGGVLVPILLIMVFNVVMFVRVMISLSRRRPQSTFEKKRKEARFKRLRNAIMVTLLLGLTWALGFLGLIQAATFFTQMIFCVVNSMQGYLIFMMYCVQQPEVRNQWKRFVRGDAVNSTSDHVYL